jgi:plasmid maintenance system antidote protein VapI
MSRADKATFMSGKEYRELLAKLGLDITKSATFLQIDRRTSSRRANEDIEIGFETAALLRLMVKLHITPSQVSRIVDKQ